MYVASLVQGLIGMLPEFFGGMAGLLMGWAWGRWQARKAWKKKSFERSVVLGLNSIDLHPDAAPGEPVASLRLRTLFERPLEMVLPQPSMQQVVKEAMDKTTVAMPILRFPKDGSWFILNAILNQIASQFAEGVIREELGYEVKKRLYLFCMTFERDDRMYQYKTRIMLMDKELFLHFPEAGEVAVETESHLLRVETLRALRKEYQQNPHLFMAIELAL